MRTRHRARAPRGDGDNNRALPDPEPLAPPPPEEGAPQNPPRQEWQDFIRTEIRDALAALLPPPQPLPPPALPLHSAQILPLQPPVAEVNPEAHFRHRACLFEQAQHTRLAAGHEDAHVLLDPLAVTFAQRPGLAVGLILAAGAADEPRFWQVAAHCDVTHRFTVQAIAPHPSPTIHMATPELTTYCAVSSEFFGALLPRDQPYPYPQHILTVRRSFTPQGQGVFKLVNQHGQVVHDIPLRSTGGRPSEDGATSHSSGPSSRRRRLSQPVFAQTQTSQQELNDHTGNNALFIVQREPSPSEQHAGVDPAFATRPLSTCLDAAVRLLNGEIRHTCDFATVPLRDKDLGGSTKHSPPTTDAASADIAMDNFDNMVLAVDRLFRFRPDSSLLAALRGMSTKTRDFLRLRAPHQPRLRTSSFADHFLNLVALGLSRLLSNPYTTQAEIDAFVRQLDIHPTQITRKALIL